MSGTLSPSEIQSLFGGLDLAHEDLNRYGSAHTLTHTTSGSDQFTLPLSLAEFERNSLLAWQATFVERWLESWSDSFRQRFALANTSVSVTRLREFISIHAGWMAFQTTSVNPPRTFWIAQDQSLVTDELDFLLGAGVSDPVPLTPRTWGSVETQLISRKVQGICDSLFPAAPGIRSSEWQIGELNSPEAWISEVPVFLLSELVQFDFEFTCSGSTGRMHIGIPRAICQALSAASNASDVLRNQSAIDQTEESVDIRAHLAPIQLSESDFQQLQIGDVLLTGHESQADCYVAMNGEIQFQATIGSHAGHKAVRLIVPPRNAGAPPTH